jgi:hypothetical protein
VGDGVTGSRQLLVSAEPAAADRLAILTALAAFNRAHADPAVAGPLAILPELMEQRLKRFIGVI